MAFKFVDRAQMTVASAPGTGAITLGGAIYGYQTLQAAGIANGDTFPYVLVDPSGAWEIGVGTYSSSGNMVTRSVTRSSNSNALISASRNVTIAGTLRAEDLSTGTLASLQDVNVTEGSGIDGYFLKWDNTSGKWVADPGSGGAEDLSDLDDVLLTSPSNNQALLFNFGAALWENASLASVALSGAYSDLTGKPTNGSYNLVSLGDVSITEGAGVDGYSVTWSNSSGKYVLTNVAAGTGIPIQNNGSAVASATTINFINATSISNSSGTVTVTLPTGGGGGGEYEFGPLQAPDPTWFDFSGASLTTAMSSISNVGTKIHATLSTAASLNICYGRRNCTGWSTPWSVIARLRPSYTISQEYSGIGMFVEDGSGKMYGLMIQGNTGNPSLVAVLAELNSNTSFNSNVVLDNIMQEMEWFKVTYDGTHLTFGLSHDGQEYAVNQVTPSFLGTLTYVGIGGDNQFQATVHFQAANFSVLCTYYSDPDHP